MIWLLLGVLALGLLLATGNRLTQINPRFLAQGLRFAAVAAVSLLALRSGRLGFLLMPALQQWIRRQMSGGRPFGSSGFAGAASARTASSDNQTTKVKTRTLRMQLDHATGTVDGEVLAGRFRGRRLGDLPVQEVVGLLDDCRRGDEEAVPLLEAYLDRREPDWREPAAEKARPTSGMTQEEALGILGLAAGASRDDVKAAHHRLMKKLHPDQGGSNYLATQVNQAKDLLLQD